MSHRPRLRAGFVSLFALAILLPGFSAPAAAVSGSGGVVGVISSAGKPIRGIHVELQRSEDDGDYYETVASQRTAVDGSYSFSNVQVWTDVYRYKIKLSAPNGKWVTRAKAVSPKVNKVVRSNMFLRAAAWLSGVVTRADSDSPAGLAVELTGPDVNVGTPDSYELAYADTATVAADGTFVFKGLPKGNYSVRYRDRAMKYRQQCYDDVIAAIVSNADPSCRQSATPGAAVVAIAEGARTVLQPQRLSRLATRITGIATDTAGRPIKGLRLVPFQVGVGATNPEFYGSGSTSTGRFSMRGMPAGSWQVAITDPRGRWASQWYDRSFRVGSQVIELTDGQIATGLAVKMRSRAKLGLKVVPRTGAVTFTVAVKRRATGSRPGGLITVTTGDLARSSTLVKGITKLTLTGLSPGNHSFVVSYGGTSATAPTSRTVVVKVP